MVYDYLSYYNPEIILVYFYSYFDDCEQLMDLLEFGKVCQFSVGFLKGYIVL